MSRRVSVLVVDDEVADAVRDTYRAEGFDVTVRGVPDIAITYLRQNIGQLDVAVLDLWMNWQGHGVLDKTAGLTVLKTIKQEVDPDLGVVVLTGHGDALRAECLAAGAVAHIGKAMPDTLDLLDKAVARAALTSITKRLTAPAAPTQQVMSDSLREELAARLLQAQQFAGRLGVTVEG
jgi:CheY-like chemotaxis protein